VSFRTPRKLIAAFLVCIALRFAIVLTAVAQTSKPLPVEKALNTLGFAELTRVRFSPDGRWLAFTIKDSQRIRTVDLRDWARSGVRDAFTGTDIAIVDSRTGEMRRLTGGKGDNFMPVWSPNGKYLAFLSDRDGDRQARLWIWDSASNGLRKLSDLRVRQFGPFEWTPDSENILVPVIPRETPTEDYVASFTSATAEPSQGTTAKVPGSTVILYQSIQPGAEEQVHTAADAWNLNFWRRSLVLVERSTGKAKTLVPYQNIAHFALSPDGSRLAYSIPKQFEHAGSQQTLFDLTTLTLSDGKTHRAAPGIRLDFDGSFNWSPDGSWLSYRAFGPEERVFDCYVVGLDDTPARNITNLAPQSEWPRYTSTNVLWDSDGQAIYFITDGSLWRASTSGHDAALVAHVPGRQIVSLISRSENSLWISAGTHSTVVVAHDDAKKQDGFYSVDLEEGGTTRLLESGQCYTCANSDQPFAVAPDGQSLAYFTEDAQHNADLWISDSRFAARHQLTHLNPQVEEFEQGGARLLNWLSDDGEELKGALLLPSDYEVGKRYPLIVWVYGGESLSNSLDHFGLEGLGPFNMQLLATRGYAVLAPDSVEGLGTSMLDLVKTVLPGVNKAIEMGVADPVRLGIMGHSHGGYNTLSLIADTKRFKAAIVVDGLADLVSGYGEMDRAGAAFGISVAEQGQEKMGGTPWQFRDRYIENSPFFYLDRVDTPVLIVQGVEDTVVPPFLSDEVFVALRRLGKEVDYAKYDGEGHSPAYWSYANQLDFCNRVIAWMDTHLKEPNPNASKR
jgi:dipeptidyl aminopeptidase/acylaminoacyl peptidase